MKPIRFDLSGSKEHSIPKAILRGAWQCKRANSVLNYRRFYLDSLDWRLLKKNLYFVADHQEDGFHLHLYDFRKHRSIAMVLSERLPGFAWLLPEGILARTLAPILKQRALLPQIQLSVSRHSMTVLDDRHQTTARLDLEISDLILESDEPGGEIDRRVTLAPVKGHNKQIKAIVNMLNEHGVPTQSPARPVPDLISKLNIDVSRFNTKPESEIHAADRSDLIVKRLLGFFLAVMQANRQGIISDVDTECLHDFRVAVRRSRSLLNQMPGVINKARSEQARAFLAQLGHLTNTQRDLDILLLKLSDYRSLLPAQHREQLGGVFTFFREQRQQALLATAHFLQSQNYQRFVQSWKKYLDTPVPRRSSLPRAARPVKAIADERIWKTYKRILMRGSAINDRSPAEELHDLRKNCKTLRYLIEFFNTLYPAGKLNRTLGVLKRLQDILGEFQDLHVHIDMFSTVHETLNERARLRPESDKALIAIIQILDVRQAHCRDRFHDCFADFGTEQHQRLFKQLFKPDSD